jgi:membrane protein YqaA with SNARE-associated domain
VAPAARNHREAAVLVWLAIILALCGNVVGAAAIGLVLARERERRADREQIRDELRQERPDGGTTAGR